jgi:peptide-methionine (S)-S-oxide reductase
MRTPLALVVLVTLTGCRNTASTAVPEPEARHDTAAVRRAVGTDPGHVGRGTPLAPAEGHALAAFAAGCFWGVEDTFRQVPGVVATAVGYTGGKTDDPTYETVCSHTTGHAETVLVEFDPKVVPYETLVNVFFKNHDPTTKNRQGPDVGDQYRSAIFTFSPAQETAARAAKDREQAERGKPVVTLIDPVGRFWKAEEYHQQYDEKTGTHSCPLPKGLSRPGT